MLKRLTITAFILAMIVVTLGALTRLLDAGLGCPDWPGCYGQIIPPQHHPETATLIDGSKAWMEMVHRYVAGLLGLIILALAICIEKTKGLAKKTRWLSRGILALVIAQALFGMWTVTMQLLPQIVTLHLLGGMLLLSLLWLLLVQLQGTKPVLVPPQMHKRPACGCARTGLVPAPRRILPTRGHPETPHAWPGKPLLPPTTSAVVLAAARPAHRPG